MKTILFLMCIAMSYQLANAQQTVRYAYDNNGNRTGRTIVLPKTSEETIKESDFFRQGDTPADDQLSILHDGLDEYDLRL